MNERYFPELGLSLPCSPVFHIGFTEEDVPYTSSKLGGKFFWPNNEPFFDLPFLAQINLEELPENDTTLPKKGILQFFISDTDDYGVFEPLGSVVVHHKDISKGKPRVRGFSDKHFPIVKPCGLKFTSSEECLTYMDYRFKEYVKNIPPEKDELYYKMFNGEGSKLLGYPFFTQFDPREHTRYKKYDRLLLQLDSDGKHIMWGDSGTANFFISSLDLMGKEFDMVLFNWDCY